MEGLMEEAYCAAKELCSTAGLKAGQIMVVGCSTSELAYSSSVM